MLVLCLFKGGSMKHTIIVFCLLLLAYSSRASANVEIMKAANEQRGPEQQKYSCVTCHEKIPTRLNHFKLNLTAEGKKWTLKSKNSKPGCAVQ